MRWQRIPHKELVGKQPTLLLCLRQFDAHVRLRGKHLCRKRFTLILKEESKILQDSGRMWRRGFQGLRQERSSDIGLFPSSKTVKVRNWLSGWQANRAAAIRRAIAKRISDHPHRKANHSWGRVYPRPFHGGCVDGSRAPSLHWRLGLLAVVYYPKSLSETPTKFVATRFRLSGPQQVPANHLRNYLPAAGKQFRRQLTGLIFNVVT